MQTKDTKTYQTNEVVLQLKILTCAGSVLDRLMRMFNDAVKTSNNLPVENDLWARSGSVYAKISSVTYLLIIVFVFMVPSFITISKILNILEKRVNVP